MMLNTMVEYNVPPCFDAWIAQMNAQMSAYTSMMAKNIAESLYFQIDCLGLFPPMEKRKHATIMEAYEYWSMTLDWSY